MTLPRNRRPNSLAEHIAARGSKCPVPASHDRLFEVHYWWHELARWYHEPDPFRYSLGALIQAARNVSFMVQTEKAVFTDFGWYDEWVEGAKGNRVMRWLKDARTDFVHRQALAPNSWLELHCLDDPATPHGTDDAPLRFKVNPFYCTHYYLQEGPQTDHGHEFIRHWSMDELDGQELLHACADVYDKLDELVVQAHRQAGSTMGSFKQNGSPRALPCMVDLRKFRVARTSVRDGKEIWSGEQADLHSPI